MHQELAKTSSVDNNDKKGSDLVSSEHCPFQKCNTQHTVFWTQCADSLYLFSKQHLLSDRKDTDCHQNVMGTSLVVRGNAELTLSSRRAKNRGPWKGFLTKISTPGVG